MAYQSLGMAEPIDVKTKGGNLRVSFVAHPDGSFDSIYLIGPAVKVFDGVFSVED
jgi:diaminopimelate epimerase